MKQKNNFSLLACAILLLTSTTTFAQAVIRITAGMNLQTEIDNSVAGTTFLVESGSYGSVTINKRVALIGTGYFLASNSGSGLNRVRFIPGSENSIITGFEIGENVEVGASGISILRCHIGGSAIIGSVSGSGYFDVGGTTIKQNYINNKVQLIYSIYGTVFAFNTLIQNNIILGFIDYDRNGNSGWATNNTILCYNGCNQEYSSSWSMSFTNNIVASTCNYSTYPNGRFSTNSTFSNNLIQTTQFATNDASNIKVVNFNNVFVGYPNNNGFTIDGRYQLLSTSPAKNIGIGNADAGAFGGNEPYVLQGIPIGPNVISVSAPTGAAAGQTISVQIQAKTQN